MKRINTMNDAYIYHDIYGVMRKQVNTKATSITEECAILPPPPYTYSKSLRLSRMNDVRSPSSDVVDEADGLLPSVLSDANIFFFVFGVFACVQ